MRVTSRGVTNTFEYSKITVKISFNLGDLYFACLESSINLVNMTCKLRKIAATVAFLTLAAPNLAISGNEPSIDLTNAAGLVAQKEYAKAIEAYTAILEGGSPTTEERGAAFYQRGLAEQEVGMTGHAIADFTQAIWLGHLDNKELATAHYRRGKGYSLLKQYSRAITDFDRAIQLEPAFAQAYSERGDAYRNRGIYKLAIQDYSTSIRLLNPDLHVPYFGRGLTHEAMGNQRLADADFRRASELEPEFDVVKAKAAGRVEYQLAAVSPDEATGSIQEATGSIEKETPDSVDVAVVDAAPAPTSPPETASSDDNPEKPSVHAGVEPDLAAPERERVQPANNVADAAAVAQVEDHVDDGLPNTVHSEMPAAENGAAVKSALRNDQKEITDSHSNSVVALKAAEDPETISPERDASETATATARGIEPVQQDVASVAEGAEPTGAIAQSDRKLAASEIREQQTAAATAVSRPVEAPKKEPASKPMKTAALPDAGGRFLVQVASYRAKDDALARFNKLSELHSDLLSDLAPDILRADLGAKGVYYRLRIGPFESFDKSTNLCNALKARKLDCLVIERKTSG